jgi:hypothetical protein
MILIFKEFMFMFDRQFVQRLMECTRQRVVGLGCWEYMGWVV